MADGGGQKDWRCFRPDLGRRVDPTASRPRAHVLYVTPEIADFVKAGGLGEVSAALPRVLQSHADVRVLVPCYRDVLALHPQIEIVGTLPGLAALPPCRLGRIRMADGLTIYVLQNPELYERPGTPYTDPTGRDWADNDRRFARLSLAAAEMASGLGDPSWRPDFLHLNDWPAALAPAYLAWRAQAVPSLLTIHNLAYQGLYTPDRMEALGIPSAAFQVDGVEFYGKLSFLKAGIFYASHVTTVSETYAREITQPVHGCGLDGLLRTRAAEGRLTGILNGIDDDCDPRRDPHLHSNFDLGDWDGKAANADFVRSAFGLGVSRGPLFAIVSRLVHQKGVDLAIDAAHTIVRNGGQLVVTGQGEKRFETAMMGLAQRHPDSVGVHIGFNHAEARCMFAGSDFLLMPSRFEPCGLGQMYAQRFGSLPIAHKTGGLADTITDGRTGFLFPELSATALSQAIRRALTAFRSKDRLERMRRSAMARAFDWKQSAQSYNELYRSVGQRTPLRLSA
jgi:starch synthase